jgi:(p)ppGpp synthase/HD superfamily hydrolase
MTSAYSTRFDEAMALALSSFRGVYRKGTRTPYITHLLSVCALVGEHGGDEDQLCAAVLHDWLEDIPDADEAWLAAVFGERVAWLVRSLSDSVGPVKAAWRGRKEAYLAALAHEPADVKLISAADKLHNCRSLRLDVRAHGVETLERFTGKRDGTLWYYQAVVEALDTDWQHPLLELLRDEVGAFVREVEAAGGASAG